MYFLETQQEEYAYVLIKIMANTWHYYEVHTEKRLLSTLVPCAKCICHLAATRML